MRPSESEFNSSDAFALLLVPFTSDRGTDRQESDLLALDLLTGTAARLFVLPGLGATQFRAAPAVVAEQTAELAVLAIGGHALAKGHYTVAGGHVGKIRSDVSGRTSGCHRREERGADSGQTGGEHRGQASRNPRGNPRRRHRRDSRSGSGSSQ